MYIELHHSTTSQFTLIFIYMFVFYGTTNVDNVANNCVSISYTLFSDKFLKQQNCFVCLQHADFVEVIRC